MSQTTCQSCGAEVAARSARWCSWCGATLSSTPSSTPDARDGWRAARPSIGTAGVGLGLGAIVIATAGMVLAVSLTVGVMGTGRGYPANGPAAPSPTRDIGQVAVEPDPGLDDLLDDEWAVEPGSAAVVRREDWSAADGSLGRSRPTCDVEGCALWRGTLLGEGVPGIDLTVGARQAVAARDGLLVAVDLATGQLRWRAPRPFPHRPVTAIYLDDGVLAVAEGRQVSLHDPNSGALRGTTDALAGPVGGFDRAEGELVALGFGPQGQLATSLSLVGLSQDGQVRFTRLGADIEGLEAGGDDLLLVRRDDVLSRVDARTGEDRWAVELAGRQRDALTLLDPATGRIEVLSPDDGLPLLTYIAPGAVAAGVRSGVLVVTTPDRLELVGRDGTVLGRIDGIRPDRAVITAAGPRVTVVELSTDGAGPRVEIIQARNVTTGLPGFPWRYDVPGPGAVGEVSATIRSDGLLVGTSREAWIVAPGSDRAVAADVPAGEVVLHTDGISIGMLADGLELVGAAGRIGVRGGTVVLDTDALLVRGPEGTLRLDRALLDG